MTMNRNLRRWLGIGAAGLAVAGAGGAVAVASTAGGDPAPVTQEAPAGPAVLERMDPPSAGAEAGATGTDREGPGRPPATADRDEGHDRDDGSDQGDDHGEPDDSDAAPSGPAAVSVERASAIALAQAPGGTVHDVEREVEYGIDAYSVSIEAPDGRALEVGVDVQTGEVVYVGEDD